MIERSQAVQPGGEQVTKTNLPPGVVSALSVKEAALALGVHWQTIYRWVKRGAIPFLKTPGGRIRIPAGWAGAQQWAAPETRKPTTTVNQ